MITGVRLVDGASELVLYPGVDGIEPQSLSTPSPETRAVVQARTGTDGVRDSSSHHGARAVALELAVYEDFDTATQIGVLLDQVKGYLHPSKRPYLYVTDDGWGQERRIMLRADQWADPYTGYVSSVQKSIQLQWQAPDGVWEDATGDTQVTILGDVSDGNGLSWPETWPISYAATAAAGSQVVSNAGKMPAHFVARLYGPCTGPSLVNVTTGAELTFTNDLVLGVGDYVEVDTREHTAYAESLTDASRLTYLDYSVSTWWQLQPGDQELRFAPQSITAGAQVVLTYRPAWL